MILVGDLFPYRHIASAETLGGRGVRSAWVSESASEGGREERVGKNEEAQGTALTSGRRSSVRCRCNVGRQRTRAPLDKVPEVGREG